MIAIALGANLEGPDGSPPHETLDLACRALYERGVKFSAVSRIWESAPVPYDEMQPWYYNAVAAVETDLAPAALLALLHGVEADFGRTRRTQNEARTLDLDLLFYDNHIIDEDGFILPHPRMTERLFVLCPLHDISLQWRENETNLDIAALIRAQNEGQDIRPSHHHFTFMPESKNDLQIT